MCKGKLNVGQGTLHQGRGRKRKKGGKENWRMSIFENSDFCSGGGGREDETKWEGRKTRSPPRPLFPLSPQIALLENCHVKLEEKKFRLRRLGVFRSAHFIFPDTFPYYESGGHFAAKKRELDKGVVSPPSISHEGWWEITPPLPFLCPRPSLVFRDAQKKSFFDTHRV